MARVAVFIASPAEIKRKIVPTDIDSNQIFVCYTGLGKVRATAAAYEMLASAPFDLAINLGTCGSHTMAVGSVVEVMAFVERDVDLSAVGISPGFFPGVEGRISSPKKVFKEWPEVVCGSGDCIEMKPPKVLCDIYDMEGFALAFVCKKFSVPLVSIKFISDSSHQNTSAEWKQNLDQAQKHLIEKLHEIVKRLPLP